MITTTITRPASGQELSTTSFTVLGTSPSSIVKATFWLNICKYLSEALRFDEYTEHRLPEVALAGGETPTYSFTVPAGGSVLIGTDFFGVNGEYMSTGLVVGVSTAYATYTAATGSDHAINGMYQ